MILCRVWVEICFGTLMRHNRRGTGVIISFSHEERNNKLIELCDSSESKLLPTKHFRVKIISCNRAGKKIFRWQSFAINDNAVAIFLGKSTLSRFCCKRYWRFRRVLESPEFILSMSLFYYSWMKNIDLHLERLQQKSLHGRSKCFRYENNPFLIPRMHASSRHVDCSHICLSFCLAANISFLFVSEQRFKKVTKIWSTGGERKIAASYVGVSVNKKSIKLPITI